MCLRLIIILSLLAIARPAAAQYQPDYDILQIPLEDWEVFTWNVAPNQFAYCGARAHYDKETVFLVSLGCGGMGMSVEIPGQRLPPGASFPVIVHIDMQTVYAPIQATVGGLPGDNLLLIRFGWDPAAFEALRHGQRLTVLARDFGYDYILTGSSQALTEADACAQAHIHHSIASGTPGPRGSNPAFDAVCSQ